MSQNQRSENAANPHRHDEAIHGLNDNNTGYHQTNEQNQGSHDYVVGSVTPEDSRTYNDAEHFPEEPLPLDHYRGTVFGTDEQSFAYQEESPSYTMQWISTQQPPDVQLVSGAEAPSLQEFHQPTRLHSAVQSLPTLISWQNSPIVEQVSADCNDFVVATCNSPESLQLPKNFQNNSDVAVESVGLLFKIHRELQWKDGGNGSTFYLTSPQLDRESSLTTDLRTPELVSNHRLDRTVDDSSRSPGMGNLVLNTHPEYDISANDLASGNLDPILAPLLYLYAADTSGARTDLTPSENIPTPSPANVLGLPNTCPEVFDTGVAIAGKPVLQDTQKSPAAAYCERDNVPLDDQSVFQKTWNIFMPGVDQEGTHTAIDDILAFSRSPLPRQIISWVPMPLSRCYQDLRDKITLLLQSGRFTPALPSI